MRGREFKTLRSIYPKKTKIVSQKDICLPMLIAALFIVEKIWKPSNLRYGNNIHPLIDEWIKKCVCVYVCISAIKKNKILPPETAWMNFEGIMSSEINQTDKDKSFIISLICGI